MFNFHIGLDQPAEYEIKIQGRLVDHLQTPDSLSDWFQSEVQIRYESGEQGECITSLTGTIMDQAALHGLLKYIRDLGLTLLYVDCLSARPDEPSSSLD